jgi:hypothetical protein
LRRAYIATVIDMHDPSAARRKSYGLGPVSVPPAEAGSSPVYHGVRAPCARGRAPVVRYGRPAPDATALPADAPPRLSFAKTPSGGPRLILQF